MTETTKAPMVLGMASTETSTTPGALQFDQPQKVIYS
jgi:hypothetical protein